MSAKFFKENFVLIVGLALPVLLVVLFFMASVMPKYFSTPPQHKLYFAVMDYTSGSPALRVDYFVKEGKIKADVRKGKVGAGHLRGEKLMVYDPVTQSVQEIAFDASQIGDGAEERVVIVDETKDVKISTSTRAPDGYVFDSGTGYRSGLVTDLFSGGGGRSLRVVKDGVAYRIPVSKESYAYNVDFLGWGVDPN
jgi:hypothetical protein